LGGYQVKATAAHFHRDPVVISQGIRRLEKKLKEERGFPKTVSNSEQSLARKRSRNMLISLCMSLFMTPFTCFCVLAWVVRMQIANVSARDR